MSAGTNFSTNTSTSTGPKEDKGPKANITEEIPREDLDSSSMGNSLEAIRLRAAEVSIKKNAENQTFKAIELENQELKAKLEARDKEENKDNKEKETGKDKKEPGDDRPVCAAYIRGDCQYGWAGKHINHCGSHIIITALTSSVYCLGY